MEILQPGASCDSAATHVVSECRLEGGGGRGEATPTRMRFTHCEGGKNDGVAGVFAPSPSSPLLRVY